MSEEEIDPAQRVAQFDKQDDVAFAVELENGSSRPIGMASASARQACGEWTLTCGSSDSWKRSIHLDLDDLIRSAELCVQKVQAASMAEKSLKRAVQG